MLTVWFVIFILLLLIELFTVNLVTIWFAIGALASIVSTYFTDNVIIQIVVFLVVSILMLIILKPLTKRFKIKHVVATNLDRVIGMEAIVTEEISKNKVGEVRVDGKKWSAVSNETLPKDTIVKVQKIEGVKLIVKKED
ncbi:MAG: NfeD family protein [Bacilli bacterium]|nr:NfeD family protein [Bacilli bacterium]